MHNQKNSGIAVFYSKQNLKKVISVFVLFVLVFVLYTTFAFDIYGKKNRPSDDVFLNSQTIKIPSLVSLDSSSTCARLTADAIKPVGAAIIPTPRSKKTIVNILPPSVIGTTSPYPTVVKVTIAHQKLSKIVPNCSGWASCSN